MASKLTPITDFDKWAARVTPETIIKAGRLRRPGFNYTKGLIKLYKYYNRSGYGVSETLNNLVEAIGKWKLNKNFNIEKIVSDFVSSSFTNKKFVEKIKNRLIGSAIPVEHVKKSTEKIRKTATKLPKKKLKLETSLEEIMGDILGTNRSAVTDRSPIYKKSRKKFRKNVLAKDYEKKKKKKKKKMRLK